MVLNTEYKYIELQKTQLNIVVKISFTIVM